MQPSNKLAVVLICVAAPAAAACSEQRAPASQTSGGTNAVLSAAGATPTAAGASLVSGGSDGGGAPPSGGSDGGATPPSGGTTVVAGGGQSTVSTPASGGAPPTLGGLVPSLGCSLYSSPAGTGVSCDAQAPCSLTAARDKVRGMTSTMTADIEVCLAGGTYFLPETFTLVEDAVTHDSGANGFNVVYRALDATPPVLSGGRRIDGFVLHDAAKNIFKAAAPGLVSRQLFVNGVRAQRARSKDNLGMTPAEHGFRTQNGSLAAFANPTKIELSGELDWRHYRCPVESIKGTEVRLQDPCWALSQDVGGGWWQFKEVSWVENAYELLDEPGEFYLDEPRGEVFYQPRSGEDLATASVIAPILETLVRGQGTPGFPLHNVVFRGLTFSHGTWNEPSTSLGYTSWQSGFLHRTPGSYSDGGFAVMPSNLVFQRVDSVRFEGNRFEHLGGSGLDFFQASSNNAIVGNRFDDISGRAITIGHIDDADGPDTEKLKNNSVVNNAIFYSGVEYRDCAIIFIGYTQHTLVEHNWLRYGPYIGVSLGWGWASHPLSTASDNVIRWNRIEDFMQHTFDGAGVYALGIQRNSSVDHNYIYRGLPRGEGIFPDQGAAYMAWEWNVIEDVGWQWIHDWSAQAHHNTLVHNITNQPNFEHSGGADKHDIFENNVVVTNGNWPAEAAEIKAKAGLEPEYAHVAQ